MLWGSIFAFGVNKRHFNQKNNPKGKRFSLALRVVVTNGLLAYRVV
jgi:hypothetical protein